MSRKSCKRAPISCCCREDVLLNHVLSNCLSDLASLGFTALDDEVYINTQSGSQWDSLKHFGHQKSGMYYNGLSHEQAVQTATNGIHNWCERGGIVGRGVLVDWLSWVRRK